MTEKTTNPRNLAFTRSDAHAFTAGSIVLLGLLLWGLFS